MPEEAGDPVSLHGHRLLRSAIRLRRLPKFDPISLRVDDPSEAAILELLDFRIDRDAFLPKCGDHGVQVLHPIVDHERRIVGSEVRCVRGEDRPDRVTDALPILAASPGEQGDHPLDGKAEMFPIPAGEPLRISRLEEDTSDSRHATSAPATGTLCQRDSLTISPNPSRSDFAIATSVCLWRTFTSRAPTPRRSVRKWMSGSSPACRAERSNHIHPSGSSRAMEATSKS